MRMLVMLDISLSSIEMIYYGTLWYYVGADAEGACEGATLLSETKKKKKAKKKGEKTKQPKNTLQFGGNIIYICRS